jgi:hypothetical protein
MAYLPPLPPGDYHLGILFETWSSKGHLLRDQPLHLDAGRPEIALAMPSLLSLTVHVEGDDLVALQGLDNGLPHARTKPDALGNATFSDLPRGQYQVYFKESVMTLVLATSTSLPFLPDPRTENR